MVLDPQALNFFGENESLELGPLVRLTEAGELNAHVHTGFWQPIDTQQEVDLVNELWERGEAPWATWLSGRLTPY